jgi:signal transduction histidine kinase/ActR/RegA family two-component response regulator
MMAIRFWSPSGREYEFDALPLNRALRTGEVVRDEELVFERVDGSQRIMIVNAAPIRDRDGRITAAVAVGSDITEKRDLEARVRRAETLEAMGRLAGAVAHDFNNLIMVVLGAAHLLTQRYASTSEAHGELEMITRSARSAADLSRSLLAFSRRQVLHREVLSVDAVIAATLPLVDRMVGDNIAICHTRADAETPVLADQASVERILVNLCMNARDAMPCGGQIEIECRRVDVDLATTECCPWMRPGEYIRLAVRDTGTGMDKATVGRALDPFFTTKDADKGTGLGLTSVYGTAKQHGGFIAIDSEPGVGTEVSVFLPCTDVDAPVPSRDRGGGGAVEKLTVLVAEDREDLLEIMCRFLEDLGHTVIPATNGGEALAMLEASNGTIDVVVTDVAMPVLGGLELRATCRQRWPQIAFVLCSGYREGSGDQEPSDDLTVRLEKPFDVGDLDKRISQVVDAARRRAHSPVISTQPSLDSEDLA